MADVKDSAKVVRTRPNIKHQVGISAGIPVITADREMQSLIGGVANRLHYIEGGRLQGSAPGTRINEYAESIVKSVIACYSSTIAGRWYLRIRVAKSPISW